MPSISVIVPVYQAENFLIGCVDSVRKQTFTDWELLLVDDCSRDGSPALCDRCATEDDRIRVYHKENNGGVSEARNLGLREAKGDYIAFLDADDRYEATCLETLWSSMTETGADSAACAHLNLRPDGTRDTELVLPTGLYDGTGIREGIVYPLLGDRLTQPVFNGFIWRYLYSAQIIREHQIRFEGAYLEDELFLMEYFCCARRLVVTDQPLYRYLYNPTSATHKYMADFMQVFNRFMDRKEALVEKYGINDVCPVWRENTNWAGLLIAIGNEYAKGNKKPLRLRQNTVKELCRIPEMEKAIRTVTPTGLSSNKQMVVRLVKGRHFFLLTQMYRLKNRI